MNTVAALNNLFGMDAIWLLLIVLILFGAKKLPELAKGMGQALKEFNKAKNEFENEISRPVEKPVAEITVQKPAEQQEHRSAPSQYAEATPSPEYAKPEPQPANKAQP